MDGVRKTALLLSGLEWKTVDLLLGRLDSESAKAVRREMMSLKPVSVQETNRLANEFLHKAGRKPRQSPKIIEHQLTEHVTYTPPKNRLENAVRFGSEAFATSHRPFDFLQHVETEDIVQEIAGEHPQTIAVVLAHLPASRAGNILACLPKALQNELTKRLAGFQETDKQILHEIELSIQERLERRQSQNSQSCDDQSRNSQSRSSAVLRKIFEASRTQHSNHPQYNTKELPEHSYSFDDLEYLDDTKLTILFRSVDTVTMLTALIGAKPEFIERVTKHFSPTEEYQMRQQLKYLGTINENDVIRARNILLDKAEKLIQ
ncbi:MAG: hypothetical protein LBP87_08145 [Planctomycetaceae bacterium]|jgi:flagellar motor switch protein FliG|nr:hypothetical protein [Planctomycetaceae bacterium]